VARRMFARCILASTSPLQFPDGRDGFLRRTLTIKTLPRLGGPDNSLRNGIEGDSQRHRQMRGELVSWALSMPMNEVDEVLEERDPAGLLSDAAVDAARFSDSVSLFADEALIPRVEGPNAEVTQEDWLMLFEAYVGWCKHAGNRSMTKDNFMGQLRKVLGPARCLPRGRESTAETQAAGRLQRRTLPRFDAGFGLRCGVLHSSWGSDRYPDSTKPRECFEPRNLGSGGLALIAALPPAVRLPPLRQNEQTPMSQTELSPGALFKQAELSQPSEELSQGASQGGRMGLSHTP
jgi:hypothetical protein